MPMTVTEDMVDRAVHMFGLNAERRGARYAMHLALCSALSPSRGLEEQLPADLSELIAKFEAELAQVTASQAEQARLLRERLPAELALIRRCPPGEVSDRLERLERKLRSAP